MRYSKLLIGLLLAFSIGFLGCQQKSTPKEVTLKFLKAVQHSDYKKAKEYATENSNNLLDALSSFQNMLPKDSKEKFEKGEIAILKVKKKDTTATVYYNSDVDTVKKMLSLRKEKGQWKIAFTKETILPNIQQLIPSEDSTD